MARGISCMSRSKLTTIATSNLSVSANSMTSSPIRRSMPFSWGRRQGATCAVRGVSPRLGRGRWSWMPQVSVIAQRSCDYGHTHPAHPCEPSVDVSALLLLSWLVRAWNAGVEASRDSVLCSGTREVLGEEIGMAQRVSEECLAPLVQVLAIHEDHHPSVRFGVEVSCVGPGHGASLGKSPGLPAMRKPGPVN